MRLRRVLISSPTVLRAAFLLATAVLLAGCSTPGGDDVEAGGGNPTEAAATSGGLAPEEFDAALRSCMEDAGWHLSKDEFGQDSIELQANQEGDYQRSVEECSSGLEVDPKYTTPLNDDQWAVVHSHYRDSVIPCLEFLGYTPDDLPSLDTFIASMNSPDAYQIVSQHVFGDIIEDVVAGRWESADEVIMERCEVSTPDDLLYP